jgi:hypothetical protein
VGFESPSIADPSLERTYLFDGKRLRALADLDSQKTVLYEVVGNQGFIPIGNAKNFPLGQVRAKASVVIVESADKRHSVALGFRQSDTIHSSIGNRCFHADPHFGPLTRTGEERVVKGKLYLIEGNAQQVFERYTREFASWI